MISMGSYLNKVNTAWEDYDGDTLGTLISFDDPHIMSPKLQVILDQASFPTFDVILLLVSYSLKNPPTKSKGSWRNPSTR